MIVAGERMDRSIADFVRACEVTIEDEQSKPAPDTALIALLCDAVRLTREYALRPADPVAYQRVTLPDYGPWPTYKTIGLDLEYDESIGKWRGRDLDGCGHVTIQQTFALNRATEAEFDRRQGLYDTHMVEGGGFPMHTLCLLKANYWSDRDAKLFATDREADVKCAQCKHVIATRRAAERARRGLP